VNDLTLIENELVPVYTTSTGEKVVYGTELHEVLDVKSRFNDWVKNRLEDCEAVENTDFQTFTKNLVKGRPSVDYIIKLNTAKEMAMLERNTKGKQVRRYFIEVEERYKSVLEHGINSKDVESFIRYLEKDGRTVKFPLNNIEVMKLLANCPNDRLSEMKELISSSAEIEVDHKWVKSESPKKDEPLTTSSKLSTTGYAIPFNSKRLRSALNRSGMTYAQFGRLARIDPKVIVKYISGKQRPGLEVRAKLCTALGQPIGWLDM
jgi:phage anti-repressor protein